jgi:hypothetical protein
VPVARLRPPSAVQAGAIVVGLTVMTEFGSTPLGPQVPATLGGRFGVHL